MVIESVVVELGSQNYVKHEIRSGHFSYTLTGVAAVAAKGTGSSWTRLHPSLEIPIPEIPSTGPDGPVIGLIFEHWAPFVTLNALADDKVAVGASGAPGWAVDDFEIIPPGSDASGAPYAATTVNLNCTLALRNADSVILRIGYVVHLIGYFGPIGPF